MRRDDLLPLPLLLAAAALLAMPEAVAPATPPASAEPPPLIPAGPDEMAKRSWHPAASPADGLRWLPGRPPGGSLRLVLDEPAFPPPPSLAQAGRGPQRHPGSTLHRALPAPQMF